VLSAAQHCLVATKNAFKKALNISFVGG